MNNFRSIEQKLMVSSLNAFEELCNDEKDANLKDIFLLTALGKKLAGADGGEGDEDLSLYIFVYLAYNGKCEATDECMLDKEHFIKGVELCCREGQISIKNSVWDAIKRAIETKNAQLRTEPEELFKFYSFVYRWLFPPLSFAEEKERAEDRLESLLDFWSLFYTTQRPSSSSSVMTGYVYFPKYERWVAYIKERGVMLKRDEWEQTLLFAALENYTDYDPMRGWPLLMDGFVEHEQQA